jgi:hypothetical protein
MSSIFVGLCHLCQINPMFSTSEVQPNESILMPCDSTLQIILYRLLKIHFPSYHFVYYQSKHIPWYQSILYKLLRVRPMQQPIVSPKKCMYVHPKDVEEFPITMWKLTYVPRYRELILSKEEKEES